MLAPKAFGLLPNTPSDVAVTKFTFVESYNSNMGDQVLFDLMVIFEMIVRSIDKVKYD